MEKKKRTTNLRTRQHLTPMRSSETLGLSAYGETVKKKKKTHTGPVSGGNTVILTDSSEGGRSCETSAAHLELQHTNFTVLYIRPAHCYRFHFRCQLRHLVTEMLVTCFGHSHRIFREILI